MMDKKELEEFLKDPAFMAGALVVLGFLVLTSKTSKARVDVPGLYERRNAAWRGRGSFGKAPFGGQVRHRR